MAAAAAVRGKKEKGRGGMNNNERDATKGERRQWPVIWRGNYLQFVRETKKPRTFVHLSGENLGRIGGKYVVNPALLNCSCPW